MQSMSGTRSDNARYFIGGSDARIVMGDDEAALIRLWREKRGEVEPEDLSGNLLVQLGVTTEDLNRRWYEAHTGQVVVDVQRQIRHSVLRWMGATLDGRIQDSDAVFEAKFMLPWSFSEQAAAEKYMPQLQHNMHVGCIASHGIFYRNDKDMVLAPEKKPATAFLLELIAKLQELATVPMIDVRAYAQWLEK
jgi:predicted phage-related endonuclease